MGVPADSDSTFSRKINRMTIGGILLTGIGSAGSRTLSRIRKKRSNYGLLPSIFPLRYRPARPNDSGCLRMRQVSSGQYVGNNPRTVLALPLKPAFHIRVLQSRWVRLFRRIFVVVLAPLFLGSDTRVV